MVITLKQTLETKRSTSTPLSLKWPSQPRQKSTTESSYYTQRAADIINKYLNDPAYEVIKKDGRITEIRKAETYTPYNSKETKTYYSQRYTFNSKGDITSYEALKTFGSLAGGEPRRTEYRTYDSGGYYKNVYDPDPSGVQTYKEYVSQSGERVSLGVVSTPTTKPEAKTQKLNVWQEIEPGKWRMQQQSTSGKIYTRVKYQKESPKEKSVLEGIKTGKRTYAEIELGKAGYKEVSPGQWEKEQAHAAKQVMQTPKYESFLYEEAPVTAEYASQVLEQSIDPTREYFILKEKKSKIKKELPPAEPAIMGLPPAKRKRTKFEELFIPEIVAESYKVAKGRTETAIIKTLTGGKMPYAEEFGVHLKTAVPETASEVLESFYGAKATIERGIKAVTPQPVKEAAAFMKYTFLDVPLSVPKHVFEKTTQKLEVGAAQALSEFGASVPAYFAPLEETKDKSAAKKQQGQYAQAESYTPSEKSVTHKDTIPDPLKNLSQSTKKYMDLVFPEPVRKGAKVSALVPTYTASWLGKEVTTHPIETAAVVGLWEFGGATIGRLPMEILGTGLATYSAVKADTPLEKAQQATMAGLFGAGAVARGAKAAEGVLGKLDEKLFVDPYLSRLNKEWEGQIVTRDMYGELAKVTKDLSVELRGRPIERVTGYGFEAAGKKGATTDALLSFEFGKIQTLPKEKPPEFVLFDLKQSTDVLVGGRANIISKAEKALMMPTELTLPTGSMFTISKESKLLVPTKSFDALFGETKISSLEVGKDFVKLTSGQKLEDAYLLRQLGISSKGTETPVATIKQLEGYMTGYDLPEGVGSELVLKKTRTKPTREIKFPDFFEYKEPPKQITGKEVIEYTGGRGVKGKQLFVFERADIMKNLWGTTENPVLEYGYVAPKPRTSAPKDFPPGFEVIKDTYWQKLYGKKKKEKKKPGLKEFEEYYGGGGVRQVLVYETEQKVIDLNQMFAKAAQKVKTKQKQKTKQRTKTIYKLESIQKKATEKKYFVKTKAKTFSDVMRESAQKSRTMALLLSKQASKVATMPEVILKTKAATETIPKTATAVLSLPKSAVDVISVEENILDQITGKPPAYPRTKVPPIEPKKRPPEKPKIYKLPEFTSKRKGAKGTGKKAKRETAYTPSLDAYLWGIKGKKAKGFKGLFMGTEFRPIPNVMELKKWKF